MHFKKSVCFSLIGLMGLSQAAFAQSQPERELIQTELAFAQTAQTLYQFQISQANSSKIELINKTGKQPAVAIGMSIIPGLGQFYNGDILGGSLYLLGTVGVLVADGIICAVSPCNINPILLAIPGLSAASMIQAGLQTQEQNIVSFTF